MSCTKQVTNKLTKLFNLYTYLLVFPLLFLSSNSHTVIAGPGYSHRTRSDRSEVLSVPLINSVVADKLVAATTVVITTSVISWREHRTNVTRNNVRNFTRETRAIIDDELS